MHGLVYRGVGAHHGDGPLANDAAASAQLDAALDRIEEANTGRATERNSLTLESVGTLVSIAEGRYDIRARRMDYETSFQASEPELFEELFAEEVHGRGVALLRARTATAIQSSAGGEVTYAVRIPGADAINLLNDPILQAVRNAPVGLTKEITGRATVEPTGMLKLAEFDLAPVLAELHDQLSDREMVELLEHVAVTADVRIHEIGTEFTLTPPDDEDIIGTLD